MELAAKDLVDTMKAGHCIIYYEVPAPANAVVKKNKVPVPVDNRPAIEEVMKAVSAFKERIASSVKLYRIKVKDLPWAPAFVTYDVDGKEVARVNGPYRPDSMPWIVHEILGYYIHSVPTAKGEYLRAGWLTNDTNTSYVNVVDVRKEEVDLYGKIETVQIVRFASSPSGGESYVLERTFAANGKVISSIETYGQLGKYGYFDHDRSGKFQYRVRYKAGGGKE